MSEEQGPFQNWEQVIVHFFETRVENIQSSPKIPCKLYKARKYIDEKNNQIKSENNGDKKEKLIHERDIKIIELQELRDTATPPKIKNWIKKWSIEKEQLTRQIESKEVELIELKKTGSSKEIKALEQTIKKEKGFIENKDKMPSEFSEIMSWIDKNSKKPIKEGKRIVKSTHVLKFTHSSATSEGVLVEKADDDLLTTSSLKKDFHSDLAHHDGALITISRFLALKFNDELIIDLIHDNNFCFLESFSENQQQFDAWCKAFSNLVEKRNIKTADRAKQAYFPLIKANKYIPIEQTKYHLLCPLFSSSLAQEIYTTINASKYSEEQKNAREQAKQEKDNPAKYYPKPIIRFPNLGIQKFGGAQPQNVSMLNKDRTWKAKPKDNDTWAITYLFNAQPPTWQSQLKPPVDKKSLFDYFSTPSINDDIHYLREYLLRFERLGLSIKDPKRQDWIVRKVQDDTENGFNSIIDEVLFYVGSIQNLAPGWTDRKNIKLDPEYQYCLDPYRDDSTFQNQRKTIDWQSVVCQGFASWLNRKLEGKEKQFTPQREHTRLWQCLFADPLREHCEMLELAPHSNNEETQV